MGCLKLSYDQSQKENNPFLSVWKKGEKEPTTNFLGERLSKKGRPLKNRVEYHPFGTTSYRAGRNEAETSLKRYRYVGKERDEETGLYYYGARYYAPWIARFVSVDPLKDDYPQLNPYNYASNDPIGAIDIDGLQSSKEKPRGRAASRQNDLARREQALKSGKPSPADRTNAVIKKGSRDTANFLLNVGNALASIPTVFTGAIKSAYTDGKTPILEKPLPALTTEGLTTIGSQQHKKATIESSETIGNAVIEGSKFAAAGVVGELGAAATKSAPLIGGFLEGFVEDVTTQALSDALNNLETGKGFTIQADDIDIANAVIKGVFGKFSKENALLVPVEEALKTFFDGTITDPTKVKDLANEEEINGALAEFGLRLAFKFLPSGSGKDEFGEKAKNSIVEISVSSIKSNVSKEIKKDLTNEQK